MNSDGRSLLSALYASLFSDTSGQTVKRSRLPNPTQRRYELISCLQILLYIQQEVSYLNLLGPEEF